MHIRHASAQLSPVRRAQRVADKGGRPCSQIKATPSSSESAGSDESDSYDDDDGNEAHDELSTVHNEYGTLKHNDARECDKKEGDEEMVGEADVSSSKQSTSVKESPSKSDGSVCAYASLP